MKSFLFAMTLCLVSPGAHATDLYRWVDKTHKVHYQDTPAEDADRLHLGGSDAASGVSGATLPYETQTARKNFPVALYVSEKCGDICNQARDFLRKRKIPASETVLTTQEDFDAFKHKTGFDNVPVLSVGRAWLKGFEPARWQDELDAAGYPK